ncbi:MAG: GNAT family N-acetyltransferase, partial [Chloroflexi bacterium]|nr:GNAT family N-acetyltransferase [Chloroflexota bacterium]
MACPEDPAAQGAAAPAPDASPHISARPYREGDEPGILAVLTAAFGRWPAAEIEVDPLEHLRWKLSNHLGLPGHHIVAEADGRIVGTQATLIQPIKVNGRVLLASQGFDVAVHPQYQRQGVRSCMNGLSLP